MKLTKTQLREIIREEIQSLSEAEKRWYNDKKKWETQRNKLKNVSDDTEHSSKDSKGSILALWYADRKEGWIQEAKIVMLPNFNLESDVFIEMLNQLKGNAKFKKIVNKHTFDLLMGGNPRNIALVMAKDIERAIINPAFLDGVVSSVNQKVPRLSLSFEEMAKSSIQRRFAVVLTTGIMGELQEDAPHMLRILGISDKNLMKLASDRSIERGRDKFTTMMGNKGF